MSDSIQSVNWINWGSQSGLPIYSKIHLMSDASEFTLCGHRITREMDTSDGAGSTECCKRCQKAQRKLELQEQE